MKRTCSLLVLNYNGQHLLRRFLGSVVIAAERAAVCNAGVTIVDNKSTDNSLDWISSTWPQVRLLSAPSNRYLYSLNWAADQIKSDLILLLNNDIEMHRDSLDPLFDALLSRPTAFSATPRMFYMDRVTPNSGRWLGHFHRGIMVTTLSNTVDRVTPTLFPCGGAMLVRRRDFLSLGGFDGLYYPAYWEDMDLGYRAWKRGAANLYQPASIMYHMQSVSMDAKPDIARRKERMIFRNLWLFTWRNVADPQILRSNIYWTARHYLSSVRWREAETLAMYHEAFSRWRQAIRGRRLDDCERVVTDYHILRQLQAGG